MKSKNKIFLQEASFSDVEFLWYLRNQPDVYKYSRQNKKVSWNEHVKWMVPIVLKLSTKRLFVVLSNGIPIGQIRFDYSSNNEAEISISIIKEFRGQGVAGIAFAKALSEIKKENKVEAVIAIVHEKNIGSSKFFEKLGFRLNNKNKNWLKYILYLL